MALEIEESWKAVLADEFEREYMQSLRDFLCKEKKNGYRIYPPDNLVFNAFNHTPFDQVKVVIIGQDPYIGKGQAHGLSFSVQKGIALPPSLKNIFKELQSDIDEFKMPSHGELTKWADQGVFLLNAILTVREKDSGSHQKKGWETFTDKAIEELSNRRRGIIFLLWGKFAQSKAALIDETKHYILKAAHPSPYSARNGFFGCKHFSKVNAILQKSRQSPVDWQID
ncbi:MAG TPA: uracil-DNA glycosylase [Sphingobacteriaceae bacterium]